MLGLITLALIIVSAIGLTGWLFWRFAAGELNPRTIKRANPGRRRSDAP